MKLRCQQHSVRTERDGVGLGREMARWFPAFEIEDNHAVESRHKKGSAIGSKGAGVEFVIFLRRIHLVSLLPLA